MVNVVGAESAWSIASTAAERPCMPREAAFCSTVTDQRRALVVPDLRNDARFARHPLVAGEPHIRFYAGLPIGDEQDILGTLCVLDIAPRELDVAAFEALEDLARMASHWLAARRERLAGVELEVRQRERLHALVALRTAELERAREAAEAASAAKSAFLATMSHEIRTPMNGVVGLIELMDRSGLPPQQQELMHAARESAHTLLGLIDDILDFSKIESGHLQLEDKPFELRRLIEGTADAWLGSACQQRVSLHVFVAPGLPETVLGDATRLRQVVANLLGNAIKFSGGRAQTGLVSLRAFAHQGALAIEVRDDGVGMPDEAIARLFRPFEQAEASTTRRFGGTGLGLAISHRLVQAMDGRIDVVSAPQAGACFTVHLPLRPDPGAVAAPADPAAPGLAGAVCTWRGQHPAGLGDWRTYLLAAGAEVRVCAAEPDEPGTLGQWLVERGGASGRVALRPGQQRGARADAHGLLWLDTDALHRGALLQALCRALEPCAVVGEAQPDPAPAPWGATAAVAPVLVAEDNPVNRLVIGRQLQRLGVPAVIVNDGDAALSRWRGGGGRFSLLLTDLHMPGLDGEALCAAIRREEAAGRRLPIVALTANAVRGEAERAIAAGMDDYLTKPVPLQRLATALRRWLPLAPAVEPDMAHDEGDFDPEALARAIGPDPEDQAEMRRTYLRTLAAAVSELHEALECHDWRRAALAAHRVKSSSHAMGAHGLGRLLDGFERAARTAGDHPAAPGGSDHAALTERLSDIDAAAARVRLALDVPAHTD
jgi:signal transduction histidine kinase/DNA-binding response OmpR family regulator